MGYQSRSYARSFLGSSGTPPGIKGLLIANIAIFLLQFFLGGFAGPFALFMLRPSDVATRFFIWQLVTYMFLHGGIWHILWNMLALWMFGCELERFFGTRRFMWFYFFCGTGAGVCVVIGNYLFGDPRIPTLGSSGAIYGILLASAVLWPDRIILFSFLFPIKMKYFVMIIGAIAFLGTFNMQSGVSDVAHLSGMAFGYAFLKLRQVKGFDPIAVASERYRAWRLARAKRKFQVYLKKQGRGPWVN